MELAVIVEDDKDQADVAAAFVRLREFEPHIALNGRDGLALARELVPSVVLLDLMLPDIDGYEVCRELRSDPRTMGVPIVMLTALHSDEHRRRGFWVGANAYVTKPYGPSELFKGIEAARRWRADLDQARVEGEIRVDLRSEPMLLRQVNDFLVGLYQTTPLSTDQINHLRQAVLEIGHNAIEWGNRSDSDKLVGVTYRVLSDRVEIVIRDQGPGFDRSDLPHAASYDDPLRHMDVRTELGLREGGFGLLITRGMVDEMRYNDPGNEVTLTKRFAAVGTTSSRSQHR